MFHDMKNATRWIKTESDGGEELTPTSGLDVEVESLTFDPFDLDPTQLIAQLALTELRVESARRDTVPPRPPHTEATILEALAAARLVP